MPAVATRSGMHVEEAEDLGLGIAEGVEHRSRFQRRARRADRPPSSCRPPIRADDGRRAGRSLVELPADRAHRTIADHGQRRANVHAGMNPLGSRRPRLIAQANAAHAARPRSALPPPACPARSAPSPAHQSRRPPTAGTGRATSPGRPALCRNGGMYGSSTASRAHPEGADSAVGQRAAAASGGWRRCGSSR